PSTSHPPWASATYCRFAYCTRRCDHACAPFRSPPRSRSSPAAVSAQLSGLGANTTYHFRIVASNGGGTGTGADQTLITLPEPPSDATSTARAATQKHTPHDPYVNLNDASVSDSRRKYATS